MDKLDRRLIQLKIEREAVKKEKDEASKKRFALIEDEIGKLEREYADLEEIWKAEKAAGRRQPAHQGRDREAARRRWMSCKRKGELATSCAELQYGKLPQLEAQLKKAEKARSRASRRTRLLRTQVGAEEIAEVVSRATGIPVSKMMQGERDKLLQDGRQAARARGRPGRGGAPGVRRDPPLALGPVRSEPALRLVPVPRSDRRGQDRAVQGAGRVPVRLRGAPDPHRHERVHGEAFGRAPDRRAAGLCRLRGRRRT